MRSRNYYNLTFWSVFLCYFTLLACSSLEEDFIFLDREGLSELPESMEESSVDSQNIQLLGFQKSGDFGLINISDGVFQLKTSAEEIRQLSPVGISSVPLDNTAFNRQTGLFSFLNTPNDFYQIEVSSGMISKTVAFADSLQLAGLAKRLVVLTLLP